MVIAAYTVISCCSMTWVLIRYYFDYERARIWRSEALETSRHDPSIQQPCQGCGDTTWAGGIPRRVAAAQAKARANSCVAWQSCRKPERAPRAASCGSNLYRSSSFCGPKETGHDAGEGPAARSNLC